MNLRLIILLILLALLTACGGQATPAAEAEQVIVETPAPAETRPATVEPEPTDAPATVEAAVESFPVTIEHKYGRTEITQRPERIVTVGLTEQDVLLALGIVPVGTTEWFGEYPGAIWPWAQEKLGDAPVPELVGDASTINFEKLAALKPDLILALYAGVTQEQYDLLTQIAPTVAQPGDYVDYGIPWQELTRTVGQAVGQPEEADRLVTEVETRFEQVRAEHPEFVGATSIVATPYEGIWVYGGEDVRGRFLTALGFKLPEGLAEITGEEFGGNLSFERADLLDVDVIIWLDADEAQGPLGGPVYQKLPVHTEGREVFLDSYDDPLGGATSFVSVLSLPFLLDGLVPKLAAAQAGEKTADAAPAETDPAAALDCAEGFRPFDHELLASEPLCLPIAPQRIVALDIASLELALLIGQPPVVTSDWMLQEMPLLLPQYADTLAGIEAVGYPAELEKILLLKPDIILAPEDTIDVEQARAIAPLVVPEQVIYDDWKLGMQFWSEVLNVPDFYAQMEANYNARVAELQAALGQPDELEVSVISASTYGLYLWMPDSPPGAILADVGLARPEAQSLVGEDAIARYGEKQYIEISEERLDLADGDALFYFTYASTDPKIAGEESAFIKTFEQKPLWQTLNAVKARKAFFVPGYWWRSQSYLLANKVIDDLFTYLTDTEATTPTEIPFPAAAVSSASTPETRLIQTVMGEIAVPVSPQRVVVLDTGELDNTLALGVKPVGAPLADAQEYQGYLTGQLDGISEIGPVGEPSLEAILALKPDLILGSKQRHEAIYPQLAEIAPTVFVESLRVPWQDNFRLHAEALGKSAEAEQLLADYEAHVAETQKALGDKLDTTISIIRFRPDQVRLYLKGSFIGYILQDVGLKRPPTQDKDEFATEISLEQIADVDADYIFLTGYNTEDSDLAKFMESELWTTLNAVKAGQVEPVDDDTWISGLGIQAANHVLDDLVGYLTKAK